MGSHYLGVPFLGGIIWGKNYLGVAWGGQEVMGGVALLGGSHFGGGSRYWGGGICG